ncbi:toxin VasX [Kangiella spongicola]|uniref:Toxin VasX N-terminal region domain-containing protein n=1 Tax=Kangiella spongicola TaxID=796379 RepID=A0A318D3N2_9GAMM|nr:toxin VasX [Kangiella spongicola]PXF63830.1 hypothetical protein DL796_01415 [Kangiella spongicola]
MDIKISYDQTEKTGLDALSGLAETTSCKPCEDPNIVPIYPVRIAFADIYGESTAVQYPAAISDLQSGNDLEGKGGYSLRILREGYVYIYDGLNDVWSIFVYSPNGSLSGRPESFAKLHWVDNADGDWVTTDERALETVYVPNSADEIWIAYSEHRWSQAIFEKAQANQAGFRDSVMTKLNVLEPTSSVFSDKLDSLGACVEDYTEDGIVHSHEEWNILSDLSIKSHCADDLLESSSVTKANSPALLVALHDPVGVVREITTAHTNKTLAKNMYLESITYPLTTAKAVETFMKSAESRLKRGNVSSKEKDMFEEWQESVKPEYKDMIEEAEANAKDYDDTLKTILDTWNSYYEMGNANPDSTPGSLQTHLTTFDPGSQLAREIQDLITFASSTVGSLSSSKLGQEYIRSAIVSESAWQKSNNPVQQTIAIVSQAISASSDIAKEVRKSADAASNLMTDLAMPFALEIEELQRIDLLKEVSQFQNGIINKTTTKVEVPIDNALKEIFHGSTRTEQSTIIQKGFRVNRNQVNTGVYKFDGEIHVARTEGYDQIKHKVGSAGAAGFALFANALNIVSLSQPQEKGQLQGNLGRIAGNRTALILASIEGLGKILDIPNNYGLDPIGRRYFVRGQLRKSQLKRLLKGTDITDDFIKTVAAEGRMGKAPVPPASSVGSKLLRTVVKVGNAAGVILGLLDLFKAYEAYKRGDSMGMVSMAATGLGALTIIAATGTALFSSGAGYAVIVGIVLLLIGFIANFFVDDPVTRWLKNGFWGDTADYLYWDDKERLEISEKTGISDIMDAQKYASFSPPDKFDISRYFKREMQEYYELIYWPQREAPPPEIRGVREVGLWPFNRTTTLTESDRKRVGVRFRLPGFVDGVSTLDARVYALIEYEGKTQRYANRFRVEEVTSQFRQNLRVYNESAGLLESFFEISESNNTDKDILNNLYWDVSKVAFGKKENEEGWTYSPNTQITIPIYYDDYLWSDGWEVESIGGKKSIRIR